MVAGLVQPAGAMRGQGGVVTPPGVSVELTTGQLLAGGGRGKGSGARPKLRVLWVRREDNHLSGPPDTRRRRAGAHEGLMVVSWSHGGLIVVSWWSHDDRSWMDDG